MFRLYSPLSLPLSFSSSEWRMRRRHSCLLCFHCKSAGGLKEGRRGGGGGGCMGELALLPCERSSIVPGTFQWLPWGPCSYPSPHPIQSFALIYQKTHKNTCFVSVNASHSFFPLLLTFLFLSHAPSDASTFSSFLTNRQGLSLLLPAPRSSLFRLIDVIVMLHR